MKKQLMSFVSTTLSGKFFATAVVALMLAGPVSANNGTPDPGVKNAVIKHISTSDETILFEVKFANEKGEKFTVVIKDESGAMLYRGVYSDKEFSKKFQLPRTENNKLFFVIKTASGDKSESFKINSNTRFVEEVVVTRVM